MPSGTCPIARLLSLALLASLCAALLLVAGPAAATPRAQDATPTAAAEAQVMVDQAIVFSAPERSAEPLTYLFERERVPVLGQTPDGRFLKVLVDGTLEGWVLSAQVELSGAPGLIPTVAGESAAPATPTPTRTPAASRTPQPAASRTPRPTPTRAADATAEPAEGTPAPTEEPLPAVAPGTPPPLTIALPDDWQSLDLVVPMRTFDGTLHDVLLTIYFGPLPDGANGFIYLYWGFPNTVEMTGEYNLWADGVQILRGSLVGDACNLGLYDQQAFTVGDVEGVGATYQAAECEDEADTAGWFVTVRVGKGTYAFYTAVEPWDALPAHTAALQAILDSVEFLPDEE